jgi:hypothetical protein
MHTRVHKIICIIQNVTTTLIIGSCKQPVPYPTFFHVNAMHLIFSLNGLTVGKAGNGYILSANTRSLRVCLVAWFY